jgi:hypothetical protein
MINQKKTGNLDFFDVEESDILKQIKDISGHPMYQSLKD